MAVGMPRRLEHGEAVAEVVALAQGARDADRLEAAEARHGRLGPRLRCRRAPGLDGFAIALADPDGDVVGLDQPPGAAGMFDVPVGQGVGADGVAVERLDQALGAALGAGVDDHVAEQVRVHPVARRERDLEDVLGDPTHRHRAAPFS